MNGKKAKAMRRALRAMKQEEVEDYQAVYHPRPAWGPMGPVIRYKVTRVGKGTKSAAKFARRHGMSPEELKEGLGE